MDDDVLKNEEPDPSVPSDEPTGYQTEDPSPPQVPADPVPFTTAYPQMPPPPEVKPRARPRSLAWLVILCIVLSGFGGLVGGFLANRIFPVPQPSATTLASATATSSISGQTTATQTSGTSYTNPISIVEIARIASPSVVVITTETLVTSQNLQQYVTSGAGSGVIHSVDGLIITNNHVIADAQKIIVQLANGESYEATLVGTDVRTDIAVIKITAAGLKPAVTGDSSLLSVGDQVVAIGNPLGELGGSVTNGIISALDRPVTLDGETENLLQTNAAINPGNSGGGLFDIRGNLVGIVEAKSSGTGIEGIGFVIPINNVKSVIDELINYGYVRGRVDLGMTMVDIDSQQLAFMYRVSQLGVYVVKVISGGSAGTAGLVSGDCIQSIDGTSVSTIAEIKALVEKHKVGDQLTLVVLRNNKPVTVTMILQEEKPISAR